MGFSTGNSGNLLVETVTKIGPEAQQEGSYCKLLGERVCPKIYNVFEGAYTMQRLEPAPRTTDLLLRIESLLEQEVWSRPALPSSNDVNWKDNLKKYGVTIPDWVIDAEQCLVHGDPTASNALIRGRDIVLCDPRPPRAYIPQCKETDMGRILQSFLGWEEAAYGLKHVKYIAPHFMSGLCWKNVVFWCGAAAARIEYLERSRTNRQNILEWCAKVRRSCNV